MLKMLYFRFILLLYNEYSTTALKLLKNNSKNLQHHSVCSITKIIKTTHASIGKCQNY